MELLDAPRQIPPRLDEFTKLYHALDDALLPDETEKELVMGTVLKAAGGLRNKTGICKKTKG